MVVRRRAPESSMEAVLRVCIEVKDEISVNVDAWLALTAVLSQCARIGVAKWDLPAFPGYNVEAQCSVLTGISGPSKRKIGYISVQPGNYGRLSGLSAQSLKAAPVRCPNWRPKNSVNAECEKFPTY